MNKFGNEQNKLSNALHLNRLLMQIITSLRGSFTLKDTIVERHYKNCKGDHHIRWKGVGYKTILDIMIKAFPDESKKLPFEEKLVLNKEVENIDWNPQGDSVVKVLCSDGFTYSSNYVIFTPSIGVLKQDHLTLFTPNLPKNKQDAIDSIGFGAKVDISFYFPDKWWDDHGEYYFVWKQSDIINKTKTIAKFGNWVLDIFSVIPNPENPKVLTIWIVGTTVPEVEKLPDEKIIKGSIYVFTTFLGHKYNITQPTALIRSNWHTNPHFRGIHSYQTKNAYEMHPSAEVQLSEPLYNKVNGRPAVLFAGEATHPYYYSTVHGAIETGYREADRVLELNKS